MDCRILWPVEIRRDRLEFNQSARSIGDLHAVTILFGLNDGVAFYPETNDPGQLARWLHALACFLIEHPSVVQRAAGDQ